jgi:holliday junction DNA helicase RuvB
MYVQIIQEIAVFDVTVAFHISVRGTIPDMTVMRSVQLKKSGRAGKKGTQRVVRDEMAELERSGETEGPEDSTFRPKSLEDVIGRKKEKEMLRILIQAAKKRGESVDHILFHGPPGLGKTTFAHVVANEMGTHIRMTSGPAIERQGDLASILTNLEKGDVLFIDEIHRLHRSIEEILYPAMEDYCLDIVAGRGPSARVVRVPLERFTLIGATTRMSMLSAPLRDRFGVVQRLDYFDDDEMVEIVERVAKKMEVDLDHDAAGEIAIRSRGTARIAQRLFRRIRDYVQVHYPGERVMLGYASSALDDLGIDSLGLDELDRRIIAIIVEKFGGGPVGLSTIAAAVAEDLDTVAEVYEPFLIQRGLIQRTARGRVATPRAYEHLGLQRAQQAHQAGLFDKKGARSH